MASAHAGVEAALVLLGVGMFVGYHVWLLKFQKKMNKDHRWHDYFSVGKVARLLWAQACMQSPAQGILAVQTIRNALMAISFLATIEGILLTACLTTLLDQDKIDRIGRLNRNDPITGKLDGGPLFPPTVILTIGITCLFVSFVCLAQAVRLYAHLGFMITAVASLKDDDSHLLTKEEATVVAVRAGVAFSLGLRAFYLYIVLVAWCAGATYSMVTGLIMTLVLHQLDKYKPPRRPQSVPPSQEDLTSNPKPVPSADAALNDILAHHI